MARGEAGWSDSVGPQEQPAKAQSSVISLPMSGRAIREIVKKSRRVSSPEVSFAFLFFNGSQNKIPRILRHFLLLIQILLNSYS
jgi:hypothetical protein